MVVVFVVADDNGSYFTGNDTRSTHRTVSDEVGYPLDVMDNSIGNELEFHQSASACTSEERRRRKYGP